MLPSPSNATGTMSGAPYRYSPISCHFASAAGRHHERWIVPFSTVTTPRATPVRSATQSTESPGRSTVRSVRATGHAY